MIMEMILTAVKGEFDVDAGEDEEDRRRQDHPWWMWWTRWKP